MESPIHYSNIALIDPVTKKATSIKTRFLQDGSKARIAKSGAVIQKPPPLARKKDRKAGPKDASEDVVHAVTFVARTPSINDLD